MTAEADLAAHLAERDALFRNPTLEAATAWARRHQDGGKFARPDVPLASVHKARLQWLESTDEMLAESVKWLEDHGYGTSWKGAPPLTPERRDADRIAIGKGPLK